MECGSGQAWAVAGGWRREALLCVPEGGGCRAWLSLCPQPGLAWCLEQGPLIIEPTLGYLLHQLGRPEALSRRVKDSSQLGLWSESKANRKRPWWARQGLFLCLEKGLVQADLWVFLLQRWEGAAGSVRDISKGCSGAGMAPQCQPGGVL